MEKLETQPALTARIDEQLKATEGHTPGPWHGEDAPRTWQLFARRVEPWPDGTPLDLRDDNPEGMELHPLQILKAPKKGTPYAEYWPEPADAALIASAPTLRALLVESAARIRDLEAQLAAQAEALAMYADPERWRPPYECDPYRDYDVQFIPPHPRHGWEFATAALGAQS